ncbi:MAG: aminoglycoside phosphotransferase family protein [Gammaproteobacteria bacterium TMED92]|nr:MAG: aminoglycoside phosphotransferase family protein [Gammaproteobacteria bacterium TMED92]
MTLIATTALQAAAAWWHGAQLSTLGNGHIHDTFLVTLAGSTERFVLQAVNREVFVDPYQMTTQTQALVHHLTADQGFADVYSIPQLVATVSGDLVYNCGDKTWRVWRYIENSRVIEPFSNLQQVESAAQAFGALQRTLVSFNPPSWTPSIADFLQLRRYMREYREQLQTAPAGAVPEVLVRLIDTHQDLVDSLGEDRCFIHGDCKINNVLFHQRADTALAVIDLDTVGLGHWAWDFGDLVRSVAFSNGVVELDQFVACVVGFAKGRETFAQAAATTALQMSLAPGYMALTLGVRFVTDHLCGDRYFRVAARGENLQRARAQLNLLEQFANAQPTLQKAAMEHLH